MAATRRPSSSSKKKTTSNGSQDTHHTNGTSTPKKSPAALSRRASSSKKKLTPASEKTSVVLASSSTEETPEPGVKRTSSRKSIRSIDLDGTVTTTTTETTTYESHQTSSSTSDSPSISPNTASTRKFKDSGDSRSVREFGGPVGVSAIAIIFPLLMLYFWSCLEFNKGQVYIPDSLTSIEAWKAFGQRYYGYILAKALPTWYSIEIYVGYVVWSALLAFIMPGPIVKGMPVPSLDYKQLNYVCNGYSSFYFTLFVSLALNYTGIFKLRDIVDNFGHLLSTAIISGWFVSIVTYVVSLAIGTSHRLSGNHIYDFFMGAPLNPRVGSLDLKMWCEIRVPWVILFYVSLSAVVKQWEGLGGTFGDLFLVPAGLWFTLLGHWIYVNACMKGEDCIPATWDIFYEKWGFMLIFWNMAGVPFTYCYNTLYLLKKAEAGEPVILPWSINILLVVVLLAAYYVWDVAQAQKSHFRQQQAKTLLHRWTFPQFSAGYLTNPTHIKTKHGSPLLTDGFWGVARKIHYTADFTMSMCWALICGFGSPIPYFYPFFFVCVLTHRVTRDMERCATKYGADWERYCKQVPWIFIPKIF